MIPHDIGLPLTNALLNGLTILFIAVLGFWIKRQIHQNDCLHRELVNLMSAVKVLEQLVGSHERRLQQVEDRCFMAFQKVHEMEGK